MSNETVDELVAAMSRLADKSTEAVFVSKLVSLHVKAEGVLYDRQVSSGEAVRLLGEDFRREYRTYHATGVWEFARAFRPEHA